MVDNKYIEREYIERKALTDEIHDLIIDDDPTIPEKLYNTGIRRVERLIHRIPTADVVEVRHGRWVKEIRPKKSENGLFYWNAHHRVVYVCSLCGRVERLKEPYCHCGAKMDGKGGADNDI